MKRWLFSYVLLCRAFTLSAQDFDKLSCNIPVAQTYSSASIAQYVQANFKSDTQKLQAIYGWVTANIHYDTDSMYNINWGPDPELKVTAALRRKKGVCENFAAVFTDIALKCDIPSFLISGYTNYSKAGHSWSAVYTDGQWLLCDPTWDAGFAGTTRYFLIPPGAFIETHMPFDPLWELLPYPVSQQQFNRGSSYVKKDKQPLNVDDSVKAFLQLDSLHQFEAAAARIKQAGQTSAMTGIWHSYVNMKIAIAYGDKDRDLYNGAVADLNKANSIFNDFVDYRNNQFTPAKTDAAIGNMLNAVPGLIVAAAKKVNKVGQQVENFQYDTSTLKSRLNALSARVLVQQQFLKQYLGSSVADRPKLFYK